MQSDTIGWLGNTGGSFSATKSVGTVLQTEAHAHVQYKTAKNLYLILGNYTVLKGPDGKLLDNSFLHFRYNRKISSHLRWEIFTQAQNNLVTKIDLRFLAGTGPRFKMAERKNLKIYVATALMYESEREKVEPVVHHHDLRSSSYMSVTWNPTSVMEIVSTSFYQPLLRHPADFRLLNTEQVSLLISKKLSVSLTWNYLYDSRPPQGTPSDNYTFLTGFNYIL